jgi:AraC-like DNA-binding protein
MYSIFLPVPLLQPYIDLYWILRSSDGQPQSVVENIFVDGHADLMFNFGVSYARRTAPGETSVMKQAHLDAQRTFPLMVAQDGAVDLVGVRFRPGGLAAFLALPVYETSNLTVDLDCLWGITARELECRLYEADNHARIALLDDFFLRRLAPPLALPLVLHVAARLNESGGGVRIAALSREVGYSIRTLDRLFRASFGFSPKFYARIARFQQALKRVGEQPLMSLTEIAFVSGYYDQAHFSREFADFAGSAPLAFRAALLERQEEPPPNLVQILQADTTQVF